MCHRVKVSNTGQLCPCRTGAVFFYSFSLSNVMKSVVSKGNVTSQGNKKTSVQFLFSFFEFICVSPTNRNLNVHTN